MWKVNLLSYILSYMKHVKEMTNGYVSIININPTFRKLVMLRSSGNYQIMPIKQKFFELLDVYFQMTWFASREYFIVFSRPVFSNFVYRNSVDMFVIDFNEMYVLPRLQFYVRLYTLVELRKFWCVCVCVCVCVPPLKFKFGTNGKHT